MSHKPTINRPFLKWAGGKAKLAAKISAALPKAQCLVEPFVGAGAIFLNTEYPHYILSDINADLINTFTQLKQNPTAFINDVATLFVPENNNNESFRALRQQFNTSDNAYEKAVIFCYLNRYGFNGLCRYNKSGQFNVSFGSYKAPYFPRAEMQAFANKLSRAELHCRSFEQAFANLPADCVVYCDPPYVPLTKSANFTSYAADGFNLQQQQQLAVLAAHCQVPVVVSNHDTPETRQFYADAKVQGFDVQRSISQNIANRGKAQELLACFYPVGGGV